MRFLVLKLWLPIAVMVAILNGYPLPGQTLAAERQEIIEQRTETSKTFKNADGTITVEFNADPLHYLDEAGTWQDIDTSIVASDSASTPNALLAYAAAPTPYPQYSVTKNTYKVFFGDILAEPIRIEWKDKAVEFYPLNFATPSVSVAKNAITYIDAWKEADLQYNATSRQLKEKIILKAAIAANSYSFLVKPIGVNLVKEPDGSISVYDAIQGEKLWSLPAPYVEDSAVDPQVSNAVTMELRQEGESQYIDLSIDQIWLNDPSRVFPVTLDPTFVPNYVSGNSSINVTVPYYQPVSWSCDVRFAPGTIAQYDAGIFRISQNGYNIVDKITWGGNISQSGSFWGQGTYTVTTQVGRWQHWLSVVSGSSSGSLTYRINSLPTFAPSSPLPSDKFWATKTPALEWSYNDGDGDPQSKFWVQIATDSTFSSSSMVKDTGWVSQWVAPGGTGQYTTPPLMDGRYFWRVKVHDGQQEPPWIGTPYPSFKLDTTPPTLPSNVTAAGGDKQVTATWGISDDSGVGMGSYEGKMGHYELQYKIGTGLWQIQDNNIPQPDPTKETTISRTVPVSEDNQQVTFQLRAVDALGNATSWVQVSGASSAANSSIVSAVGSGSALSGGYKVTVSAQTVAASQYLLKRSDSEFEDINPVLSGWLASPQWDDTTQLAPHGAYYYRVQTMNSVGEARETFSEAYPTIVPNNLPAVPQADLPGDAVFLNSQTVGFRAITPSDGDNDPVQLKFSAWTWVEINGGAVKKEYSSAAWLPAGATGTPVTDTITVGYDGAYKWRVEAYDGFDIVPGAIQTFTVDTQKPTAGFRAANAFSASPVVQLVDVSAADTPGGTGIASLFFSNDGTTWTSYPAGTTAVEWTLPAGDGPKTIYLKATDRAGNESDIFQAQVTLDTTAPGVPQPRLATGGNKQVTFEWLASSDDLAGVEGSGNLTYEVQYSFNARDAAPLWRDLPATSALAAVLGGLADNQPAAFRVRARDQVGNVSAWSEVLDGCSLAGQSQLVATHSGYDSTGGHYLEFEVLPVAASSYAIVVVSDAGGATSSIWLFNDTSVGQPSTGVIYRDNGLAPHGSYQYKVVTVNLLGEETHGAAQSVVVANNAPTAPVLTAPVGWVNSPWVTLTHEVSTDPDLDVLTYRYTVRDETTGQVVAAQTTNPLVTGLAHGHAYSWSLTVEDGYTSVTSSTAQFALDLAAPEITLDNLSDTYAQSQSITVTAQDSTSGLASLEYRWNAEAYQALPSGQVLSAPHGKNTLSVRARDIAGNVQEVQHTYFVDQTPPEVGAPAVTGTRHTDGRLFVTSNSEVFATWRMSDPETGIASYRYGVVKQTEPGNLSGLLTGGAGGSGPGGVASAGDNYRQLVSQPLLDGEAYLFAVEATNGVGRITGPVYSEPIHVDASPPVIAQIAINGAHAVGGSLYTSNFNLLNPVVTAEDPHSGVAKVEYALVEEPGLSALAGTGAAKWVTDPRTMDASTLNNGKTYYYAIRVTNGVGLAAIAFSGGITLDNTAPAILRLEDEGVAKRENTSLLATVQAADDESGIVAYRYAVGTTPGGQEITRSIAGNQAGWLTVQASGPQVDLKLDGLQLPNGTYYFAVKVENGAGLLATAVADGMAIDSNLQPVPKVADDGVYTADTHELHATVTFADAERPVSHYLYQVEDRQGTVLQSWQQADLVSLPGGGANASATAEILAGGADPAAGLGLSNGQTYYFKVKAVYSDNTASEVGSSNGITVDTTRPTNLSIDDGRFAPANNLRVSWQARDPESGISAYRYAVGTSRGGGEISGGFIPAGTATSVAITNLPLQDGQTCFVTVVVTNGAGLEEYVSSDGVAIDSTPPPAPKVLDNGDFFSPVNQNVLTASWTWTPSDPQSGTVGYAYALTMERKVTASTSWAPVGTQTKVSLPVVGLNLLEGAAYYFAVKATNGAGLESVGFSDGMVIDSSVPGLVVDDHGDYSTLPDRLAATITGTDLQSGIQSYRYRVGTEAEPALVAPDTTLPAKGGSQDVEELLVNSPTRLTDGGIYFFDVSLANNAGLSNGTRSDGVMVDTLAPRIAGVADDGVYTRNNQELFASWTAQATPSGIVEYEYALTTNPNETAPVWQSAGPAAGLSSGSVLVKNLALTDGVTYYFLIRAKNAAGTYTPAARIGRSDGITVDTSPPAAPVVQDDGAYTTSRLHLHWEADDPHSGVKGYRYAVGTTRGGWDVTGGWVELATNAKVMDLVREDLPLLDKVTYYFAVQAQNGAGDWSEVGLSDGITADLTPPVMPVVQYASDYVRSRSAIENVTWTSGDPETGIAAYRYAVVTDTTGAPVFGAEAPVGTGGQPAAGNVRVEFDLLNLNLAEDATYYVAIQTRNSLGIWSATSYSRAIHVDTIAPTASFDRGTEELVTNDGKLGILWQTDEGGTAYLTLTRPDGAKATSTLQVAAGPQVLSVAETLEGIYTVELYVVDAAENTGATVTQRFRLNARPRVDVGTDFTVRKGEPFIPSSTVFDPDGTVVGHLWDFGDGTPPVAEAFPSHLYSETGAYTATLMVTDNDGGIGKAQVRITVTNTSAGALYLDETWSGKMAVTGEVIVPANRTLTITAGTQVTVSPGAGLTVQGKLIIAGESGREVLFQAATGETGSWKGIILKRGAQASSIAYATIRHAIRGVAAIESPLTMQYTTLDRNEIGLHAFGSAPVIDHSFITNSTYYGIKEDAGANPVVTDCVFGGNGAGDYYDELEEIIPIGRLNELGSNRGNR